MYPDDFAVFLQEVLQEGQGHYLSQSLHFRGFQVEPLHRFERRLG